MPSAVSRLRSQFRQNGEVVDAMMPKTVPSARRNRSAGAFEPSDDRPRLAQCVHSVFERSQHFLTREYLRERPIRSATDVHIFNKTYLGIAFAPELEKVADSSSLKPRRITASILVPVNPARRRRVNSSSTLACSSRRTIARNRLGRNVSRLILMWPSPAREPSRLLASSTPLVVARDRVFGYRSPSMRDQLFTDRCRNKGSPPVRPNTVHAQIRTDFQTDSDSFKLE